MKSRIVFPALVAFLISAAPVLGGPLESGFTYQGQLKEGGTPANGLYDLTFTLWDAASGGGQIGGSVTALNTQVADGLFTVQLNQSGEFGPSAFSGEARWLEITVEGTPLAPRQALMAAPYALFALDGPGSPGYWAGNGTNIYNTNSGAVGIGTDSPQADLHIDGEASSLPGLHVHHPGSSTGDVLIGSPVGTVGITGFANNGYRRDIRFLDGGMGLYTRNSPSAPITGNGITINDAGNVGIGTAGPSAKLEVLGAVGQFGIRAISPDIAVYATHDATTGSAPGVYGVTNSASAGAHGVRGLVTAASPASDAAGVHGTCSSSTSGMGVSGEGYWGVYGEAKSANGYGGVFVGSDGIFGTGRALLAAGDAEVSDSLLVGNAFVPAAAKLHVVNGTDSAPGGGGFVVTGDTTGANISIDNNEIMARNNGQVATLYLNNEGGDVRIGQNGSATCTVYVPVLAITGADLAEKFPVSEVSGTVEPGTVMEIDPANPGKLRIAQGQYNRRVAGVVSGAGDIPLGAVLGNLPGHEDAPPVALSGRVWVRCDATEHAIDVGDLLTTGDTPGHAMKAADHSRTQGAILGKAMTALSDGQGLVLVLVSLQ